MTLRPKEKGLSREEDYRDYQDRDNLDGWPYSDESGLNSTETENREYGETPANFDEAPSSGVIGETADAAGREEVSSQTLGPLPADRIVDDALEAAITDRFVQAEDIDAKSLDVHVIGGIATLEGSVETEAIARQAEALVLSMSGVIAVRNNLKTIAVDSHIPPYA